MSTHLPGFSHFPGFLHYCVLAKLATHSLRVKRTYLDWVSLVLCDVGCLGLYLWCQRAGGGIPDGMTCSH